MTRAARREATALRPSPSATAFTHEVVAQLPASDFVLGRDDILGWIAERTA